MFTTGTKIKSLEMLPRGAGFGWSVYSESDIDQRLANAVAWGANTIKFPCVGLTSSGYPGPVQLETYVQSYCNLLRKYGLKHLLNVAGAGDFMGSVGDVATRNANVAIIQQTVAMWMKHGADLFIGGDLCNEVQFGGPGTWPSGGSLTFNVAMANDLAYFLAQIRAVTPGIPWSFSVYHGSPSNMSCDLMKLQSMLGCDYHDYHPYNGNNNKTYLQTSDAPKATDPALLESQSWFIGRHFVSENGILNNNTTPAGAAWIAGLAGQAARPLSIGVNYFGDIDYGSQTEQGNYGLTGHPSLISAFKSWPGATL